MNETICDACGVNPADVLREVSFCMGEALCAKCDAARQRAELYEASEGWADDMDGDAGSALASAGFGTDEDYGG